MSSLSSRIAADGVLRFGALGPDVVAAQLALASAGYRVGVDGVFGPGTLGALQRFQRQHGLVADGELGPISAALLDAPHGVLVETAKPELHASGFPHDDTASMVAFYGDPRKDLAAWEAANVVRVPVPFPMTYRNDDGSLVPIRSIQFHRRAAAALGRALDRIAAAAKTDAGVLTRVSHFSGSGNFRPVRGSSRLSCHAFWAAIDFDAEHLPLGHDVPAHDMPQAVVDAFLAEGLFWGGNYSGRKDPMHFQAAHE